MAHVKPQASDCLPREREKPTSGGGKCGDRDDQVGIFCWHILGDRLIFFEQLL